MSLHIMFSNRLDVLAGRLSDAVGEEQRACGPFAMTPVVVPNPNLARWLQFFIAERRGVAANLEFPYLESGMWQLVCGLAPAGAPRPQLLTHEKLQQLIAAQLVGGSDASASPFVEYCRNAAGEFDVRDAECIRRVWQISGRLATLFREYDYHREGMVRHWLSGADASFFEAEEGRDLSASQREMESAQRALYRAIFLPGEGVLARLPSDAPLWSLRMLCDHYLGDVPDGTRSARVSSLPNSVRLFGLSQLSRFHCELLYRLARLCRVELYHFNVCSEFWEDVTTPREDRWRRVKDTPVGGASGSDEELDLAIENPLLKAWGKAGRETIKLLADLEDQYQECIVDWVDDEGQAGAPGQPGTVLRRIQDAVLLRTSAVGSLPQDRSVQVAGCPGIQREIETVYNSIVTNMDDPETGKAAGLRLTDIAVLVPDMATYKPVIASVFDAHGAVPYSLVDSNAFLDSVFGAAVLGILDLVGSAFTRRKVFEVIFNPCVLAGAGVTHADACQWLAWADELGVFHSFDAAHRVERGLGATSAFTWEQALRRLRLGRILSPPSAGGGIAGPLGDIVPYEDMRSDSVLCEHFNVLLERLFRRLHPLAEATHSCAEWYDIVRGLIEDFLDVPEDMNGEAHVRRVLLNGLADLGGKSDTPGLDAMLSCVGLASGVGFPWVREWLASSLAAIPSGKGAYLTGGVTVASLLPMRPIPFKIVYIVGLGEGGFPGRDERSTLDLRRLRRRVGDVSSTDAGRYLFLETLSSVRAKLVLSYVERDLQKDEELFPCSVLKQLMAFAAEHVLSVSGEESVPLRVYHPPLNGFALTAAQGQSEACSEWTDLYREWSVQDWVLRAQQAVAAGEASAEQVVAAARSARDRLATAPGRGRQIRLLDALLRDLVATDMSAGTAEAAVEVPAAIAADLRDLPLFAGGRTGGSAEAPVPAGGEVVRVTISQLADFIRDPAQACMKRRLGIYAEDDDSEAALAEDEPFAAGFPESYQLVTSAVHEFLAHGGGDSALEAARAELDRHYADGQRRSRLPERTLGALDREALWEQVVEQCATVADAAAGVPPVRNVLIGSLSAGAVETGVSVPPLVIPEVRLADGTSVTVELSGLLEVVWPGEAGAPGRTVVVTSSRKPSVRVPRHVFRPFLFSLLAQIHEGRSGADEFLRDWGFGAGFQMGIAFRGRKSLDEYRQSLDCSEARRYLTVLLSAYLSGDRYDLLPYDLIASTSIPAMRELADAVTRGEVIVPSEARQAIRDSVEEQLLDDYARAYRPMEILGLNWEKLEPPEDAVAAIRQRILPIWACTEGAS